MRWYRRPVMASAPSASCVAKARHLATLAERHKRLADFWGSYRQHRRRGKCPCKAAHDAAYDWDF